MKGPFDIGERVKAISSKLSGSLRALIKDVTPSDFCFSDVSAAVALRIDL